MRLITCKDNKTSAVAIVTYSQNLLMDLYKITLKFLTALELKYFYLTKMLEFNKETFEYSSDWNCPDKWSPDKWISTVPTTNYENGFDKVCFY